MHQLQTLYRHILDRGVEKTDRTGTGTISVFGYQMRFDLSEGFPLDGQKFVPFKLVASELLWFLKGKQDYLGAIEDLHADNNHIWDEWVKDDGSFGPIYGVQWRRWMNTYRLGGVIEQDGYIDQIANLIKTLKTNPDSRRMIVTAWQPSEIADMALPPCHVLFQLNTRPTGRLVSHNGLTRDLKPEYKVDLQLYQRSCDAFLGVPFNIASYALLLEMICHVAGQNFVPGEFVWTGGDVHIYKNHVEQVQKYLEQADTPLPKLHISEGVSDIDSFKMGDFDLAGYTHSGKISAPVAV